MLAVQRTATYDIWPYAPPAAAVGGARTNTPREGYITNQPILYKEEREHCSALAMQPRRYMRRGKADRKLDLLELAIYTRNIVPLTAPNSRQPGNPRPRGSSTRLLVTQNTLVDALS